jgi:hypothetical protein
MTSLSSSSKAQIKQEKKVMKRSTTSVFSRTRKKNQKKAESIKTFIEIIFFVALFFIGLKIFNTLMEWWVGENLESGTVRSMERLRIEIENMVGDETQIPLYIDKDHSLRGYEDGVGIIECKAGKACICICSAGSACENNARIQCTAVEQKIEPFSRTSFVDEQGETVSFPCKLTRQDDIVKVACANG